MSDFKKTVLNNWRNKTLLSQLVNVVFGLVSGKIIAVKISPENFGRYNLEFGVITFFYTLLLSPFIQYCKLHYRKLVVNIGYGYFVYLALILLILSVFLFNTLLNLSQNNISVLIVSIISTIYFFLILINALITDFYNLNQNVEKLLSINLVKSISSLVFLLVSLFLFETGTENWTLWTFQLVGLFVSIFFFKDIFKGYSFRNRKLKFKIFLFDFLKYSWPLIVLAFWNWISSYMDRYIINYFISESFVGLYYANFSLGSKFFILVYPFFLLKLTPEIYNNKNTIENKIRVRKYVKMYSLLGLLILFFLYFFKNYLGLILLSRVYEEYFSLIFWSGCGYFFLTLTYLYESFFYVKDRLSLLFFSSVLSALVTLVLNFLFIPLFSVYGAAYSFILASVVKMVYVKFKFDRI